MLEKNRIRAMRRFQAYRIQKKRLNKMKGWRLNRREDPLTKGQLGYLKSGHWGCGCRMCKPWKFKMESPEKPSLKRKLGLWNKELY